MVKPDEYTRDLEAGFRTAMREGFVHTANAFAEMLGTGRDPDAKANESIFQQQVGVAVECQAEASTLPFSKASL